MSRPLRAWPVPANADRDSRMTVAIMPLFIGKRLHDIGFCRPPGRYHSRQGGECPGHDQRPEDGAVWDEVPGSRAVVRPEEPFQVAPAHEDTGRAAEDSSR